MIDPTDKQTAALPLEQPKPGKLSNVTKKTTSGFDLSKKTGFPEIEKRGRGRPATGAAMTPAEKQRAYRQRLKEQNANQVPAAWHKADRAAQDERIEQLEQQQAEAKQLIKKLKADLSGATDMLEHMKFRFEEQRAIADKFAATIRDMKKGNVTEYAVSTPRKVEATLQARYKGKGRWVDIDRGSKEDIDARARGLNQLASEGRTEDKYRCKPV